MNLYRTSNFFNPRPTKPFFVTWFTKGGGLVTTPLMNLNLMGLKYDCLVLKKQIFSENRPKLQKNPIFSLKKFQISEFRPFFLLIKKGNGVSNMS